ncbi:hypothetical protein [Methanoplanus limicola]|nr:hypothetical protein [Methanoplanus limicola]
MKKIMFILIALAMLTAYAAAEEFETEQIESVEGYTVSWIEDKEITDNYQTRTVYETIVQGETDWLSKTVNSYTTQLHIDLNWGDSSDSLRLKIYSPDGHTFGYYYDNSDGSNDGRIQFNINNPDGIARGTWRYEVYGYDVSGTEDYTI